MNDVPHPSPPDPLERGATRLNFWAVWGFAVFDVMLALLQPINPADAVAMVLVLSAVTCQVSLLTIWVALGPRDFRERLLTVAPAYALAAWYLADFGRGGLFSRQAGLALLLLILFNAIIPYGLLQLLAVRCLPPRQICDCRTNGQHGRPLQFSLAALFKMTFVAACAAAAIRLLQPQLAESVGETVLLGLASLFGLGGIWSMLAMGAHIPRAAVFFASSILGGLTIDRIISQIIHASPEPWLISLWVTTHLAVMLGVLAIYRRLGYRAIRGDLVETQPEV